MRVLITGGGGMLARDVAPALTGAGHDVHVYRRAELDVTDERAVRAVLGSVRPDAVVQCAAYTAVDRAEAEESLAYLVNAEATAFVARECQKLGSVLVYPSTDYVFPGDARRPYRPTDPTGPINAYGRTKLAGEEAAREAGRALVVRTSWLYGAGGRNFVDTIAREARRRDALEVVADQTGRPTWTVDLADVVVRLLAAGAVGTFHATGGGSPVTWYGLASEIVRRLGMRVEVRPVSTSAFARPAPRPAYSVLDCSGTEMAVGMPLPDWGRSLTAYLGRASSGHGDATEIQSDVGGRAIPDK